ncbi:zinc finger MYM-type protein 1-like [Asparagus officinalis]|uniref:zinc finger MYM-type protein 1-like n=1 Tax=Asparagus officinalis TaxID=4686 RepID=UPI00098E6612|nr:zinc finger MYM-type protein 1-like [Asparagus officinalis]
MLIDIAIDQVKGLIRFFEDYREVGLTQAMTIAKEIATEMEIDSVFQVKRQIRRKKQFDENVNEETTQSAEESFRINYFLYIVDQAIGSLKKMFEQYKAYEDIFGFLFGSEKLNSLDDNNLKACCDNLEIVLKYKTFSDLDGKDLFGELKILRNILPKETKMAIDILNFLKIRNCFPNACIAYRILLTIPVTVASAERSFSKLKLLKSYLRSTMSQERLNGLALISIENDFIDKIDVQGLISDFAAKNARRTIFR